MGDSVKFTATARSLGIISAAVTVILVVAYAVTLTMGLLFLKSPQQPIGDPMFTSLEVLIILMMAAMVALMVAVHAWAPMHAKTLRACADRSWSARRSTLPTIPTPCLPDQSPNDDDHLREGHPEIYHPPHPLRAPHEFLVGVVPRTRPLHHPLIASPERCRLAFLGDLGK